jgi:hypothetical protein
LPHTRLGARCSYMCEIFWHWMHYIGFGMWGQTDSFLYPISFVLGTVMLEMLFEEGLAWCPSSWLIGMPLEQTSSQVSTGSPCLTCHQGVGCHSWWLERQVSWHAQGSVTLVMFTV